MANGGLCRRHNWTARVSELLGLKWADVDFATGEIHLSRGIVRQHIGEMKTEASRKPVPMDSGLADVFAHWREIAPVQSGRGLHLRQSTKTRHATVLAECCDGRSHSASSASSRNPETYRLAYFSSHIWNTGKQRGRGRCDDAGTHASRKREYHDGQIRPGRDASEARGAVAHGASDSVPKRSHAVDGSGCNWLNKKGWALNSAVECHLHTVEVTGSNPVAPTMNSPATKKPSVPVH